MNSGLGKLLVNTALAIALVFAVSSCGRRGDLEQPPSSSVIESDESGEVVEREEVEDRPFILDPLI